MGHGVAPGQIEEGAAKMQKANASDPSKSDAVAKTNAAREKYYQNHAQGGMIKNYADGTPDAPVGEEDPNAININVNPTAPAAMPAALAVPGAIPTEAPAPEPLFGTTPETQSTMSPGAMPTAPAPEAPVAPAMPTGQVSLNRVLKVAIHTASRHNTKLRLKVSMNKRRVLPVKQPL